MAQNTFPPKYKKIILIGALIAIAFLWYMAWQTAKNPPAAAKNQEPTFKNANLEPPQIKANKEPDFEKTGTVVFNVPGLKPDTVYLEFEEPGAPALNTELAFDLYSICVSPEEAPEFCSSLDSEPSARYREKRVSVQGVRQNDGSVLVKRIGFAK